MKKKLSKQQENRARLKENLKTYGKKGAEVSLIGFEEGSRLVGSAFKKIQEQSRINAEIARQYQEEERENELKKKEDLLRRVPKGKHVVKVKKHFRFIRKRKKAVRRKW